MTEHHLAAERLHFAWDNSMAPLLAIEPGDTVTFETWDASGHYYTRTSTAEDMTRRTSFRGHALTGPVRIHGASPGATLVVDVVEVKPAEWGWTSLGPRGGLLAEDFPQPYMKIWDLSDGQTARGIEGVAVPLAPFCGVMGVALAEPGEHSTIPPRRVGGNMDVKQLTAGSTLYLPIECDGALFSVGDAHGVQGDGEVCISAVEMDSTTTLRFTLSDVSIREPQIRLGEAPTRLAGPYHGCTAHAPDLLEAAKNATRYLIDWICKEAHLSPQDAYALCSVAAELRLSQVVDMPNYTVTAWLPLGVLHGAST
jgi:acetamidase/formamidase